MTGDPIFALEGVRLAAGAVVCGLGLVPLLLGVLAILRFPDFYTRVHGFTLMHAVGAPLVLAGLALAAWDGRIALKLLFLALLLAVIAPAIAQMSANAAHGAGLAPLQTRRRES